MTPFAQLGDMEKAAARGEQLLKRLSALATAAHPGTTHLDDIAGDIARSKLSVIQNSLRDEERNIGGVMGALQSGFRLKSPSSKTLAALFGRGIGNAKDSIDSVAGAVRKGVSSSPSQESGAELASIISAEAPTAFANLRRRGSASRAVNSLSNKALLR